MMKKSEYESPQCIALRVEPHSYVLSGSNERYTVNRFNDPFGEEDEEE